MQKVKTFTKDDLLIDYFDNWIDLYKRGSVRKVTLEKYLNNAKWLKRIASDIKLQDINRSTYQRILNAYAEYHEKQTVVDFHHQIKGMILDAVDEYLIERDPTRKVVFKGKQPRQKKQKYLDQYQVHNLLEDLDLDHGINSYHTAMRFQAIINDMPKDKPIFVNGPVCNSTPNHRLARHCKKLGIPVISIHGLRHTHASLLLSTGVSVPSISKRLGHASIATTQKVYLHLISELENQDNDQIMRYLSSLN